MAQRLTQCSRVLHRGDAVGVGDGAVWCPGGEADAHPSRIDADLVHERPVRAGERVGIAERGATRRVENRRAVPHGARHRVFDRPAAHRVAVLRAERVAGAASA